MSRGYVYILTNPSMPGLVKIGKTTRDPDGRANELYSTGVPTPFVVDDCKFTPDCDTLERSVHVALSSHRVSQSREFFKCDIDMAHGVLDHFHMELVQRWVDEFTPDYGLIYEPYQLGQEELDRIAGIAETHSYNAVSIIKELTTDELAPAIARHFAKMGALRSKILEPLGSNVVAMTTAEIAAAV
tara:strand:- start:274 stop:831 length:558 start_codon:yes stop_codon:yes gene_type:complete